MDFDAVLVQVRQQLESEQRIAYRILKRRFQLDGWMMKILKILRQTLSTPKKWLSTKTAKS